MIRGKATYKVPKGMSRKYIRGEVKTALGELGRAWHREFLPEHFKDGAASKYRYAARTAKHNERKLRKFGHQRPLVFTGRMAAEVIRMARITPTSKGVRVTMKGPKYLYMRRRDQKQPDKAKELTATPKDDVRAMSRILHKTLSKRMNQTAETITARI